MALTMDVEGLSVPEMKEAVRKLGLRLLAEGELSVPFTITDDAQRPRGYLASMPAGYEPPSEEFMAELRRRMANPDAKFLTLDEFLATLDDIWAKQDAESQQPHVADANGC